MTQPVAPAHGGDVMVPHHDQEESMESQLEIDATNANPALLDLPWDTPLAEWPKSLLAALPRGISRHTVRFAHLGDTIVAIKETPADIAHREYELLRDLRRLNTPSVQPVAVVTGRATKDGEELLSALVTEHLPFSLPYRALFSNRVAQATTDRLIDSLAVLLVRLHLLGFYWGDVSLSNTLFRRDATGFAAYLVDAETGQLHPKLTDGQRAYDLELARVNIIGELMDLQAGGLIDEDTDTIATGNRVATSYEGLWDELTSKESFSMKEKWRVAARIKRLNDLGFDVGEMTMVHDAGKHRIVIRPKVVDADHNRRQVMRLTGLDCEEMQAKRIMGDIRSFRAMTGRKHLPIEQVAHLWLTTVFEPTIAAVPEKLAHKLEPAQLFHEILEHRWYLSENKGTDVGMDEAIASFLKNQLSYRPDEESLLDYDAPIDDKEDGHSASSTTSAAKDAAAGDVGDTDHPDAPTPTANSDTATTPAAPSTPPRAPQHS